MTHSHNVPSRQVGSADEAARVMRAAGLRVTASRRAVAAALFAAADPLTAEQIAEATGGDLASVYRNLDTLEGLGLARHVHLGHGPGCYSPAGTEEREYLVCEECGDRLALPAARLDRVRDALREDFGFEARFSHFPVVGRCARCGARARDTA